MTVNRSAGLRVENGLNDANWDNDVDASTACEGVIAAVLAVLSAFISSIVDADDEVAWPAIDITFFSRLDSVRLFLTLEFVSSQSSLSLCIVDLGFFDLLFFTREPRVFFSCEEEQMDDVDKKAGPDINDERCVKLLDVDNAEENDDNDVADRNEKRWLIPVCNDLLFMSVAVQPKRK